MTLLKNTDGAAKLPLAADVKVYADGVDENILRLWATPVETPEEAEVAVLRIDAPWEPRGQIGEMENFFRAGSLDFHADFLHRLKGISQTVPTVLDIYLDRPVMLGQVLDSVDTLIVNFGANDEAFFKTVFGEYEPQGRLPIEIPRSMERVYANATDVPNDTVDPVFEYGAGLRYESWTPTQAPRTLADLPKNANAGRWDLHKVKFSEILDTPEGKALVDEYLPGVTSGSLLSLLRPMTFAGLLKFLSGNVPDAQLRGLRTAVSAIAQSGHRRE
ncbi:glycoside hydrolase family 3 C-terminal domain-containing protein [Bacillus sp. S34]|nr:glycoside hydrolase family 3 C-terminal domain-containing protein [Bacillus sp. S34]